ncbi:MAG: glycosyltransferase family 39 protein [Anaerolineaceae bacterium]|nr:glycosyltransferase family 39 protein [Anaerolineaceae bacterium]
MFAYSLAAILYLYRIARIFLRQSSSVLAVVLLVTTIPFINFSLQIRGYCLSITLLEIMIYHTWQFEKAMDIKNGVILFAAATLAVYTIPSNLYFILSVIGFYMIYQIIRFIKYRQSCEGWGDSIKQCVRDYPFRIIYLLIGSFLLSIILYLPVIKNVINNPFVVSHGPFRIKTIIDLMPQTLSYFLSERWWILPFVVIGFVLSFQGKTGRNSYYLIFCITVLVLPFVISFVRGDKPFDRTFVILSFVFVLILTICLDKFLHSWKIIGAYSGWIVLLFCMCCYSTYYLVEKQVDAHIYADINLGKMSQDLQNNFYLEYYSPSKVFSLIKSEQNDPTVPVFVVYPGDMKASQTYLSYFKIKYAMLNDNMKTYAPNTNGEAFVVTAFPANFSYLAQLRLPGTDCTMLNNLDFYNVFKCQTHVLQNK